MSKTRITAWASLHGFAPIASPGFAAFERIRTDGTRQQLGVFRWGNAKVADSRGIPRSYLVAVVTPAVPGTTGAGVHVQDPTIPRIRIPLVEWPSETQAVRSWSDVRTELADVVLQFFDAPLDQIDDLVRRLREGRRNVLT